MAYNEKREVFKHFGRSKDHKPTRFEFKHQKPPTLIFLNDTLQEAIEQIKENKKLVEKVSTVINSTAFNTFSTEYQEKIQDLAVYIRTNKLY